MDVGGGVGAGAGSGWPQATSAKTAVATRRMSCLTVRTSLGQGPDLCGTPGLGRLRTRTNRDIRRAVRFGFGLFPILKRS